jgi:hypothetical protein
VGELSEAGFWGALTLTARLIAQAQERGEQTAWIAGESVFFPPDLAWRGIDLAALTVIRTTEAGASAQAADWLVRSGAFALVVLDGFTGNLTDADLGRLGRLAEDAATAVIFLTKKEDDTPSMGALPLRVAVRPRADGFEAVALKDKRGAPGRFAWRRHGPMGLY